MKRFVLKGLPLFGLVILMAACVTVNVYFPAAKVEKTAERIVSDVYGQEEPVKEKETKPTSWLGNFLAFLGPRQAFAQDATSVSNASIRGLKARIAQNHQQLLPFYAKGNVGIKPDGYLALRTAKGLQMAQIAALKRLMAADNGARSQLYKEVTAALNLGGNQVAKVAGIFAKHWRSQAQPRWLIN